MNKNGKNQVVGMDVEVARKIAKDLGVKLVIKQMNFSSLLVALQSGKVDMVLAAMSPTNARRKSIDFSKTYYKSGQDILINKTDAKIYKDHKSFANKKVGVQNGSLQETLAKTQMKSSTTCLLYTSDAADEGLGVDLGGRRIIKKKKKKNKQNHK
ncbi:amino acid ABC transporter permease and substrate binding components [Lactobacillus rhamnosus GG] [Lacticaseibacillus rhamnosus]|nr:amino acid ABC transporter permease and substrate binding components [Lactobacillus rhamnosus GG] [Lacticaseibacillus rhamnosus]